MLGFRKIPELDFDKKQKAAGKILEELYPETPIPLDHKDPYTLLVAVLLSAQCTDERVNKITPALFALADNPKDMALKDVEEIKYHKTLRLVS